MAKLDAEHRNKLKKGSFALQGKRKYPIHDKAHAKAALSMSARKDTEGEASTVRKKVLAKYPGLKKKPGQDGKRKSKLQPFTKKD
jgi:hypothetical protein